MAPVREPGQIKKIKFRFENYAKFFMKNHCIFNNKNYRFFYSKREFSDLDQGGFPLNKKIFKKLGFICAPEKTISRRCTHLNSIIRDSLLTTEKSINDYLKDESLEFHTLNCLKYLIQIFAVSKHPIRGISTTTHTKKRSFPCYF